MRPPKRKPYLPRQINAGPTINLRLHQLHVAPPRRLEGDEIRTLTGTPNADELTRAALMMQTPLVRREATLTDVYQVVGNASAVFWCRLAFPSRMHSRIGLRCFLIDSDAFSTRADALLEFLPALLEGSATTRQVRWLRAELSRLGVQVNVPSSGVLNTISNDDRASGDWK